MDFVNGTTTWEDAAEPLVVMTTAHISKEDIAYISHALTKGEISGMEREYGWLINTANLSDKLPSLAFVQGFAKGRGYNWILFDSDAPAIIDLPLYDGG